LLSRVRYGTECLLGTTNKQVSGIVENESAADDIGAIDIFCRITQKPSAFLSSNANVKVLFTQAFYVVAALPNRSPGLRGWSAMVLGPISVRSH
jgi:hypothetical protein